MDAAADVHVPRGMYDIASYPSYIQWFHSATRVRCIPVAANPPEEHVPDITDTYSTRPAVAYNTLVRVNFVLVYYISIHYLFSKIYIVRDITDGRM